MLSRFRRHFRQQLVGYLALFVALGGSAYAAATITGDDVKNRSLTGLDIKNRSLTGLDVKNNSLHGRDIDGIRGQDIDTGAIKSADIRDRTVTAADLDPDALAGAKGEKGEAGPQGEPGASGAGGAGGSSIVNQTRSSAPVTPTVRLERVAVPLTGNTWTQGIGEIDQFFGTANITVPADCAPGFENPSSRVEVFLSVDGGTATTVLSGGVQTGTSDVQLSARDNGRMQPGSATANTLTATFQSYCTGGSHATLNSLKADVIGTR